MRAIDAEEDSPWRCSACGYDVRGLPVGGRCSECGETLDARSFRPRWMRPGNARGVRRAAAWACAANLTPVLAFAVALVANVLPQLAVAAGGLTFAAILAGLAAPFVQWIATLALSRQGFDPPMASRIRRCGWIRVGGLALGLALFFAAVAWAVDDAPWVFLIPLAILVPGVGSDLVLGRIGASIARDGWRPVPVRGRFVSVSIAAMQVVGGLLLLVPFSGWVLGPLVWSAGNGVMFGRLIRAAHRVVRED